MPEPRSRSGCATCTTARCCVVFDPELTGADLHRLVRGRGLDPADIAELRPVRVDQAGPDAILLAPSLGYELRLRTKAWDPNDRRCTFLVSLGPEVHRCGVYQHRPIVCRTFPTELTSLGVMVGNPEQICPPNAWSAARADLPGLRLLHAHAERERTLHRAFVARWNEEPRGDFASLTQAMLDWWDHQVSSSSSRTEPSHD